MLGKDKEIKKLKEQLEQTEVFFELCEKDNAKLNEINQELNTKYHNALCEISTLKEAIKILVR